VNALADRQPGGVCFSWANKWNSAKREYLRQSLRSFSFHDVHLASPNSSPARWRLRRVTRVSGLGLQHQHGAILRPQEIPAPFFESIPASLFKFRFQRLIPSDCRSKQRKACQQVASPKSAGGSHVVVKIRPQFTARDSAVSLSTGLLT